jgi:hypothetical protein
MSLEDANDTNNTNTGPDALDLIGLEAARDEQDAARAREEALNPPPPEGVPDPADIWALIPKQLGALLSIAMPELGQVYTDDACRQWGVGMAAVSQKYGWDAAETLGKFAPELALVTATIPLAVPTYFAVRKRADAARIATEQRERMQPPAQAQRPMQDLNASPMAQEPGGFVDPH